MAKYESVNGRWPEGTNDGRDIKPTPQEALAGARRLYRKAMGRPWKGEMKLTSGRRHTWVKRGVFYVNPNETHHGWSDGGGWHEIVHSVSHLAARRLYGEGHGSRHAWIEKELIQHVVDSGWLEGKLRREPKPKPAVDPLAAIQARIKRWETKARRADTALRKLRQKLKRYQRQQVA